jgi:prolyl-tRNA synthetase
VSLCVFRAASSEKMMNVYADFAQNFMAIPVVKVLKPKRSVCQRETYCIEALMQDGKHYKQERPII